MKSIVNVLSVVLVFGLFISCQPQTEETEESGDAIEVIARDYSFQQVPDSIPSGWHTFRLKNEGKEPHFFLFDKMPEDKNMEDFLTEVGAPFDSVWHQLRDGEIDAQKAGAMLGEELPEWYFTQVEQTGGTGLIMPGMTAQTTMRLDPGTYVMECYVKTPEGEFHVSVGMAAELEVTDDTTDAAPPEADMEIALTNDAINTDGNLSPGTNTVAVHFKEHPEIGVGNDVHLVRMNDTTSVDTLKYWINWMNVGALKPPAPAEFLGGTQEMPVGNTAYFTVDVEPGRYLWITESANPANIKVKEFTIE